MAVREQTNQQSINQMCLTNDHLRHLVAQRIDKEAFALDTLVKFFDVYYFTHIVVCVCLMVIL